MRAVRLLAGLASTALTAGLLLAVDTPAAQATSVDMKLCSAPSAAPCVVSVTVNGVAVPRLTGAEPVYWVGYYDLSGANFWGRYANANVYGASLVPSDVVKISIDIGTTFVPRVTDGVAFDSVVTHSGSVVTFTTHPAHTTPGCDSAGVCKEYWERPASAHDENRVAVSVSDGAIDGWTADQRESMAGFEQWANPYFQTFNPVAEWDGSTYVLPLEFGNQAYNDDHSQFKGFADYRLPYAYLQQFWGIPSPSTLTSGGMTVSGTGIGSVWIRHDPAGGALLISLRDITFTSATAPPGLRQAVTPHERRATIRRGVIVPTRPRGLTGRRAAPRAAVVRVGTASRARGALVRGYQARCVATTGHHVVKAGSGGRKIRVAGLRVGVAYTCKVRAKSKAGFSPWSVRKVKIGRRP